MDSTYMSRITYSISMVCCALLGCIFCALYMLEYAVITAEMGAFNLFSLSYVIYSLLAVVIPILFVMPGDTLPIKIKYLKYAMYALAIPLLILCFWVFVFLGSPDAPSGLSTLSVKEFCQDSKNSYGLYKAIYLMTGSYNPAATLIIFFSGLISIVLGVIYDANKKLVIAVSVLLFAVLTAWPCIMSLSSGSTFWIAWNWPLLAEGILFNFALIVAAKSDASWSECVWGSTILDTGFNDVDFDNDIPFENNGF